MVQKKTRKLTVAAMMTALAYIFLLIGKFVLPTGIISFIPAAPFLNYDPKDIIIVLAGFVLGPIYSFAISVIVSFFEMITISSTGIIGFFMNVVSTCFFACPAAYIYKKVKSSKGAIFGLLAGVASMTIAMVLWNYIITPFYQTANLDSYDRETAKQMIAETRKMIGGMLMTIFVPFNLIKASVNMAFTLLLYKPVLSALKRAGLSEIMNIESKEIQKVPVLAMVVGTFLLISSVVAILAFKNII